MSGAGDRRARETREGRNPGVERSLQDSGVSFCDCCSHKWLIVRQHFNTAAGIVANFEGILLQRN